MIKYYLKFALRNIRRQKIYSIINILGLAIGIALFLVITLYVQNEYSFDKNNTKYKRIYRMEFGSWCVIPPGIGHILSGQIPEIEKITRILTDMNMLIGYEDKPSGSQLKKINVQHCFAVDSTFFEIFDAEFISGSAETVLREPLTIVLTESISYRLFGDEDPLGKIISINNQTSMRVDGVVKDFKNSQFIVDAFYSVTTNDQIDFGIGATNDLGSSNYLTYLLFNQDFDTNVIRTKIFEFFKNYQQTQLLDEDDTEDFILLRPLEDIYFFKEAKFEAGVKHGNKQIVNSFIIIAIFILLIAGINFINLTTARASMRSKEVGIKKVAGSTRSKLISQFLIESTITSLISMLIALTLLQIILPEFNTISQSNLNLESIFTFSGVAVLLFLAIFIGVIAGLYPALHLSYFNPVLVLKGESSQGRTAGAFRKTLITFQFIIATILIASTFVVNQQINYLKNKDLGFKKENVINLDLSANINIISEELKQKLIQNPNVMRVSFSHGIPGQTGNTNTFAWDEEPIQTTITSVDKDFFELYDIQMIDGSTENWMLDSEQRKSVIINETLAKMLGWEDPVGKMVIRPPNYNYMMNPNFRIVGVFKDFHIESLHTPIVPMVICRDDRTHWQASIKISNNTAEALQHIESVWNQFIPNFPFQYTFLDQKFDQMYKSEERMQKIAIYFSILAIFIACLGLFGLSVFMTQRRFKEIGIRKVLGSSIKQIIIKLSREIAILVLISNMIAIPLSWALLNFWLNDYPYRISVQWWVFPIALMITLSIALLTVSFHSLKAAMTNPVNAIRHE